MFLIMYYPTNVGQYGKESKQGVCKINRGKNVINIYNNSNKIVIGINRLINNPSPIITFTNTKYENK